MQIRFNKSFIKQFSKLNKLDRQRFDNRLRLFKSDQFHPLLKNHILHGPYLRKRSINVTSDLRALYIETNDSIVTFVKIGSHSKLYG